MGIDYTVFKMAHEELAAAEGFRKHMFESTFLSPSVTVVALSWLAVLGLYAVVWTPWLLAEERHSRNWDWRPAVILALIALADPRWIMLAGVGWWGYGFACSHTGEYIKRLKELALSTGLAVLLAAPLTLPLFEYIQRSTRALMQSEDSQVYSLPLIRLLGLVFPDQGGFHEWMVF